MATAVQAYEDEDGYDRSPPQEGDPGYSPGGGNRGPDRLYLKELGDTIEFWFLKPPPKTKPRIAVQHFIGGRGYYCENCTNISNTGSKCLYVQRAKKRLLDEAAAEGKALEEKDAWLATKGSTRYLTPVFANKTIKSTGKVLALKAQFLELGYKYFMQELPLKEAALRDQCETCSKGKIKHLFFGCATCQASLTWDEEDRKKGIQPMCGACKTRVSVVENIECSNKKCDAPKRGSKYNCAWSASVKWDEKQRKKSGMFIDNEPFNDVPEEVRNTPWFDPLPLIKFTPMSTLLHMSNLGTVDEEPASPGSEPTDAGAAPSYKDGYPDETGGKRAAVEYTDDIPF